MDHSRGVAYVRWRTRRCVRWHTGQAHFIGGLGTSALRQSNQRPLLAGRRQLPSAYRRTLVRPLSTPRARAHRRLRSLDTLRCFPAWYVQEGAELRVLGQLAVGTRPIAQRNRTFRCDFAASQNSIRSEAWRCRGIGVTGSRERRVKFLLAFATR